MLNIVVTFVVMIWKTSLEKITNYKLFSSLGRFYHNLRWKTNLSDENQIIFKVIISIKASLIALRHNVKQILSLDGKWIYFFFTMINVNVRISMRISRVYFYYYYFGFGYEGYKKNIVLWILI